MMMPLGNHSAVNFVLKSIEDARLVSVGGSSGPRQPAGGGGETSVALGLICQLHGEGCDSDPECRSGLIVVNMMSSWDT